MNLPILVGFFRERSVSLVLAAVASVFTTATVSGQTVLDAYVAKPDPTSSWTLYRTLPGNGYSTYIVDLTSQSWRDPSEVNRTEWQHWLSVVIPDGAPIDTAMLHIAEGNNGGSFPGVDSRLTRAALATNSVMAKLHTVPNQPLRFSDEGRFRREDEIVAYTYDKFLSGGDEQWPLPLPMVKSAVQAMDTVQQLVSDQTGGASEINGFTLYGVSKRGWTSWLTAAVDSRVRAIVPTVFDFLNMDAQRAHHEAFYEGITDHTVGGYSWTLHDYVDMDVMDRLDTPDGQALLDIVDPYRYRNRYEDIPKLIINATGDEFSVPNSSQHYFDDLPGESHLRYVPNSGHTGFFDTAVQFHQAVTEGVDLPSFSWTVETDGRRIRVTTDGTPLEVKMWQAHNPTARDFRHSISTPPPAWHATLLSNLGDGQYIAEVPFPEAGATAFLVELAFDSGSTNPYLFTTEVSVVDSAKVVLAGDFDSDGDVDGDDFLAWQAAFGCSSGCLVDADGDDDTDGDDFLAWQAQFGSGAASTGPSRAVPEPSSWLLLHAGLAIAVSSRWRLAAC